MSDEFGVGMNGTLLEFDFTHTSGDPNPSWLLDDIHELIRQRSGEGITLPQGMLMDKMSKQILKQRRLPDKLDIYKNLQKEKAAPPPTTAVYAARLKKSKVGALSTNSEEKVNAFLQTLADKRKRKKEQYDHYMRKSQGCPSPTPHLINRFTSSSRPVLDSLPTREVERLRPRTAPNIMTNPSLSKRPGGIAPLSCASKSSRITLLPTSTIHKAATPIIDSPVAVAKCFTVFAKIAKYAEYNRVILLLTKAHLFRQLVASRRITKWWRMVRDTRRRLFKEKMPRIFTMYLRRFQKKKAAKIITTFIRECSSVQSAAIVKKFLICVRKVQCVARACIAVRQARLIALHKLWKRTELQYRRLFADHEKETLQRLQKERVLRLSSSSSASVHDKWGLTHQQVVRLCIVWIVIIL